MVNHLRNLEAIGEEYEVVGIFPCRKIGNMEIANFFEILFPKLKLL